MHPRDRFNNLKCDSCRYVAIAFLTVIFNIPLLSNPGFYSHDEWQIHDYVAADGLRKYIENVARLVPGGAFGAPVRPIGFVQMGVTAPMMQIFPVGAHAFNVFFHVAITLLLARVLRVAGLSVSRATVAALLFGASPLAAFAIGWTAAVYDQWYSLFALLALWTALSIKDRGYSVLRVAALAIWSFAGLLSKETAIALPIAVAGGSIVLDWLRGKAAQWKIAAGLGVVAAAPLLIYVPIRASAILASLGQTSGAYTPSIRNIPYNTILYFSFPFLTKAGEIVTGMFISPMDWALAIAIHLVVIACIFWRFRLAGVAAYIFFYYVFLLPVLTIQSVGSHYLYASAFSLSVALACLIMDSESRASARAVAWASVAAATLLFVHFGYVTADIYADGVCQHEFLSSLDAYIEANGGKVAINDVAETRWWVGVRAVHDRPAYPRVRFLHESPKADLTMTSACHVIPASSGGAQ